MSVDKTESLADILQASLREPFLLLCRHEPGVRRDANPADLHDMRVGSRRLRSILRLFEPLLSDPAVKSLQLDLKWIAKALGAVNDLALQLRELDADTGRIPRRNRSALQDYHRHLSGLHAAAQRRLKRVLDSARYADFLASARAFIDPPLRDNRDFGLAGASASLAAPRLIGPWLRKSRRAARGLSASSGDPTLHRFRILCKRLRYACACFTGVCGTPLSKFTARLEQLQTVLGTHQDIVTQIESLRGFMSLPRARRFPEGIKAAKMLLAHKKNDRLKSRARVLKALRRFERARAFRKMASAGFATRVSA
jgi:CHAD domain-containing protein